MPIAAFTPIRAFGRLLAAALLCAGASAWAAAVSYDVLLDVDSNAATGCTVALPAPHGSLAGVERVLTTTVTTDADGASVTGVWLRSCSGAALGDATPVSAGGWPVGLGAGAQGTAIVETFVPLAQLGDVARVRAGVLSTTEDGSTDVLLADHSFVIGPDAPPDPAGITPIPTLSPLVLALLAAGIGLAGAWLARRRGGSLMMLALCVLLGGSGLAWAAAIVLDGQGGDWAGLAPVASGAKGDAPPNADLVALWATQDGAHAYFRIDADVVKEPTTTDPDPDPDPEPTLALGPLPDRSIAAGQPWALRLAADASDPAAALSYAIVQGPAGAALAPEPLLTWTPAAGDVGSHAFTVAASDGTRSAQASFNVTVTAPVNRPPVIEAQQDAQMGAGSTFTRAIVASDPDGDPVTLALLSGPPGASLVGTTLTWPTGAADLGEHFFSLLATDSHGAMGGARFAVRVLPQAPPVALDDQYTVRLGQTFTLAAPGVLGNDSNPNGGALAAEKLTDPDKGSLTAFNADGSFTYQAPDSLPPAPPFKMELDWSESGYTGGTDSLAVGYLNDDGVPDILRKRTSGFSIPLAAFDGASGELLWETGHPFSGIASDCYLFLSGPMPPVIADIDDDGVPEVISPVHCSRDDVSTLTKFNRVIALNGRNGTVRWLTEQIGDGTEVPPGDRGLLNYTTLTVTRLEAGGPVLVLGAHTEEELSANTPCQYIGGGAEHKRCRRVFALDGRDGTLVRNWYAAATDYSSTNWSGYDGVRAVTNTLFEPPFVADLDGDGHIEILYEGTLWREDGTFNGTLVRQFDGTVSSTPQRRGSSGFGVADLDGDGRAEIVFADLRNQLVRAQRPDGTLLWETLVSHCHTKCEVSIVDVDGDGAVDVLLASRNRVTMLDGLGRVRWAKNYEGDSLRGVGCTNRPAVYDLDGDGVPEVVVRVNKYVRALRGDTGAELDALEIPGTSSLIEVTCTYATSEIRVVDQRGDGAARLVFASAYGYGFAVLKSANTPWMPVSKRHGAWIDLPGAVDDNGHVNLAGLAPGMGGRPNVFGQQVQQATRPDLRNRDRTSFAYEARAGTLASAPATVRLNLLPENGAPRITSTPPTAWLAGNDANFSYNLTAVDPDVGDTQHWSITSYVPVGGSSLFQPSIDASTGVLTQARASGEQYLYTVRVTDSQGAYDEQTFSVNFTYVTPVAVPNVIGQSRNAAFAALAAVQLSPGTLSEQFDDTAPTGTVMIQSPASGTAYVGTGIHLTFSKGPAPRPAPNVVGTRLATVGGLLPAPFSLGTVSHAYSSTVEQGRILSQLPAAGEQVVPGAVAVVVSGGTGLSLHLNRDYSSADLPITFTASAFAPDGAAQPLPALSYTVTPVMSPHAGSLPTVSGSQIRFGSATRGSFRLSATGGGRSTHADFAVGPPAVGGEESPMVEYVQLMETLQGVHDLMAQAHGKDTATAQALLTQAVNRWRALDRDALRLTAPMTIEDGFLPTLADLAAQGVAPGPQDALNKQLLRQSIQPLKDLTAGLRARHTPLTQIDALAAAFDAKARLVAGLTPSEYGTVMAAPEYALIVSHAIPELIDALMDDLGEGVGLDRAVRSFPGLKSALVDTLATLAIDKAIETALPLIDGAKKYAKDILGQAAWGAAVVALANHAREFLDGQELGAIGSGASMSIHVFESPWAFIEANGLEWEYTELNTVALIGPDVLTAAKDVIDKIKDAWSARPGSGYTSSSQIKKDLKELKAKLKSLLDSAGAMADTVERSFQGTDEEAEDCLFSSHPDCTMLLFSDGFDSVYHYDGPSGGTGLGGLPVPIVFIVRNNVSGQIFINTPVFLPTPTPTPAPGP